jgi:hypothetical protein
MQLIIHADGSVRCLYGEAISLRNLGPLTIHRASHVEPDADGCWHADLSPVNGPTLGPFVSRSEALSAEESWLMVNRLV